MKKLLGVIVLLSVGWLGTTAYIGNNIEDESKKLFSKLQEKYTNMGMELKVDIKEKSFFTSKAEMTFNYTNQQMKDLVGAIYNLPMKMDYEIEHGPVFFKHGLGFGLSRIYTKKSIVSFLNEALIKDMGLSEKDLVLTSNSIIGFSKNMHTDMTISPMKYKDEMSGIGVDSSALEGHYDINLNTMASTGNMSLPFVKIYNPANPTKDFIDCKDTTVSMDIKKFLADGLYVGDMTMKTKEITVAIEDFKEEMVFGTNFDIKIDEDKEKNLNISYEIDAEHFKGKIPKKIFPLSIDPKKISFDFILEGLSPEGLIAFQKYSMEIQKKTQELMKNLYADNDEAQMKALAELGTFQEEMQTKMIDLGQDVFAPKKGKITCKFSVEDEKKSDNHMDIGIAYIGDKLTGSLDEISETFKTKALELFTANIDITLDDSILAAVKNEMNDREKQQIDMGLMMGTSQGIVKKEGNSYKIKADYSPNKLILNGKDMSTMINMIKMQVNQ